MNAAVLYDEDLDGITAAHAAWRCFGDRATYNAIPHGDRSGSHHDLIPDDAEKVYLLDWPSWSPETLFEVSEQHELYVIDHHETILEWAADETRRGVLSDGSEWAVDENRHEALSPETRVWSDRGDVRYVGSVTDEESGASFTLVCDTSRSAAPLTWQYFHEAGVPPIYRYVEDRDLWTWELEGTEEVLLGLQAEPVTIERIEEHACSTEALQEKGAAIKSYRDQVLSDHVDHTEIGNAFVGDAGPYRSAFLCLPHLRSEMADWVFRSYDEVDLAWIYSHTGISGDRRVICSLRSRPGDEEIHVGDLCSMMGGGGHPCAGGFAVPSTSITREETEDEPLVTFEPVGPSSGETATGAS